ncbi:hypothetical protein A2305_03515 [Candidatus Curtissbacteria bacterium RIFOXYB2_FULL_41_10]|nr:MAG: hypothetical protein A2305_03515 [Candidatus Curtissbacteria bacterium RIFOXYB2_FULL_41_10]
MGIDGVLLSPDQTIGIYRIGHPNYTVNDSHHSLRKTLTADLPGNIRIPDGIVFETSQGKSEIRALCEYSLGRLNDRKRYQRNRFRSEQAIDDILVGGFLQEQIGEYLAGLNLGLSKNLTRSGEFLFIYNDNEIAEGFIFKESDMTCRIHVPFTREAFKGVISTLVEDIQNSLRQDPETPRLRSGRASSG